MSDLTQLRIGIDLAMIADFESMLGRVDVLEKVFSDTELEECLDRREDAAAALARRFAAKEALMKAAGHTTGELWRIEISHEGGVELTAQWDYLRDHHLASRLSVASAGPFAIAVALVNPMAAATE